jgi:hypothetical protein
MINFTSKIFSLQRKGELTSGWALIVLEVLVIVLAIVIDYTLLFAVGVLFVVATIIFYSREPVLSAIGFSVFSFCILWEQFVGELSVPVVDICLSFGVVLFIARAIAEGGYSFRWSNLTMVMFVFIILIIVGLILGFLYGRDSTLVLLEGRNLLYYVLFFVTLAAIQHSGQISLLWWIMIIVGVVTVQYIGLLIVAGAFLRIPTYHADIFPLMIPLAIAALVYEKSAAVRIGCTVLLILYFLGLLISMARAEWVGTGVAVMVLFFFLIWDKKFTLGASLMTFVIMASLLFVAFFLDSGIFTQLSNVIPKSEIGSRASSIGSAFGDMSFLMRVELNYTAFARFLHFPIFGAGLGDVVNYKILYTGSTWSLDTSHLQILWKMGVVGFMTYCWLLVAALKRSSYVFRNSTTQFGKWLGAGIFSGLCGLIVLASFSAAITKYNLNIIIAAVLAFIEYEAVKIEDSLKKVMK